MAKYWFARRFPVDQPQNNRMAPVSSEGWAVVTLFVGCLVAGAVGLFLSRSPIGRRSSAW